MKRYHVYAIGNALVDLEFEVSEKMLERLHVEKGVMTLVDAEHHHQILDALRHEKYIRACGGSAANTLIAVNQFGGNGFYSCKVAKDQEGDFYVDDLHQSGVHTNHFENERLSGVTGKCIILITPDADRTMITHLGITEHFSIEELDTQALSNSTYLYIEGYLVASPTAHLAAIHAKQIAEQQGTMTALTLSDPNMVTFFKDGLNEIIGHGVDLMFCNRKEALLFTDTYDLRTAAEALKRYAKQFVITLGPGGSLLYDGKQLFDIPAYDVEVIDTVGAGDMFAGAFLYAITHGHNFESAGHIASVASATMVSKVGPRMPLDEAKQTIIHACQYAKTAYSR